MKNRTISWFCYTSLLCLVLVRGDGIDLAGKVGFAGILIVCLTTVIISETLDQIKIQKGTYNLEESTTSNKVYVDDDDECDYNPNQDR